MLRLILDLSIAQFFIEVLDNHVKENIIKVS
jgi:hypothetical protein